MKLEIGTFGVRLLEDVLMEFQQKKSCRYVFRIWGEIELRLCHYVGYRICCFIVSPNIPALTSGKNSFTFFHFNLFVMYTH
jgi:hypothetical protein